MILVQPTMLHLLHLCSQARPDEIAQYEALVGRRWDIDAVAVDHYNRIGVKFALLAPDGMPIAAGGWDPIIPGVWQSWMVGTMDNWDRHWRSLTKATRHVMDVLMDDGARRLQTNALASRTAACRWYEKGLKMRPEGVMHNFGVNGEAVAMYARTRPGGDDGQQR